MLAELSLATTLGALFSEGAKKCRDVALAKVSGGTVARIAGHLGLPANHDAQKAIRRAQLYALQNTLNGFEQAAWDDDSRATSAAIAPFAKAAHGVLHDAIGLNIDLKLRQDDAVVAEIAKSLDSALAGGTTDRALALRRAAEEAVWAEFTTALGTTSEAARMPPRFEACFRGEEVGVTGWFDGCVAFVGEALKTDAKFAAIFSATRLAELVDGQAAQAELVAALIATHEAFGKTLDQVAGDTKAALARLDRVLEGQRVTHEKLDAAEDAAERRHREQMAMLVRLAADKGVPEAPLRAALARLGESGVSFEQIPARLAAMADELVTLRHELERLRNDRPEFAAIRARALALIDKGELDAARGALQEGRGAARDMREEMSRTEAAFLLDEARVDRLQLRYDDGSRRLDEAVRLDPDNVLAWGELGDLWALRGSLWKAERAFLGARDACVRSGNDRDLSVSHNRIGDVRVAQGKLAEALTSFAAGLAIAERLAWDDPGNARWRRDLSVAHNKIGDVRVAQGQLAEALTNFAAGLAIAERLAQEDPSNAGWQRDVIVSCVKIADVDLGRARESLQRAYDIATRLSDDGRLAPRDAWMVDELARRLADLPS